MNRTIVTIICFSVALGLGLAVVWPQYQDYEALKLEVEKKETELVYHQEYFAKLKETDLKLKEYEASFSKIDCAFPDYFSIPAFFANMQKISSQSGMVLNQISEGPLQQKGEIKERSFNLSLFGNLASFKNFLFILENSAKIIEVGNFGFSSPPREGEPINFTLGIKTYSH